MPASTQETEFVAYVLELMHPLGPIRAKRMFGGHGVFLDDLMLALIVDGILYLKTDARTQSEFTARGLNAFSYIRRNREVRLSYHQAPEEALENAEDMRLWAGKARQASLRAASGRNGK
ncbi:hypothetical protein BI364_11075 [Acidihalobacter yilgarnensis]|uniref:TfoX N-terminal domain-containing protein n=1 Tax=Acidihalobacter yilgarnensis TaxID=2819280 RepID=A0A1D8IPT0_9GAMM|nr:TfoX/Sxy family protein [Acidihalobacter yilgarnensis]AOU98425.1 hypothetical protein BI364_11075 [Acidihalobacter yilgarnensis]